MTDPAPRPTGSTLAPAAAAELVQLLEERAELRRAVDAAQQRLSEIRSVLVAFLGEEDRREVADWTIWWQTQHFQPRPAHEQRYLFARRLKPRLNRPRMRRRPRRR